MLFNFNVTNYQEYIILHETLKENKLLPHICKKKKKKRKRGGVLYLFQKSKISHYL